MNRAEASPTGWNRIGNVEAKKLAQARLTTHWAAQIVAAGGLNFLPPAADDSHPNMEWSHERDALLGRLSQTRPAFRLGLRFFDLMLLVLDDSGRALGHVELAGKTIDQAYEAVLSILSDILEEAPTSLRRPGYELPPHEVANAGVFEIADPMALKEMALWYGNAHNQLEAVHKARSNSSSVRCWPHHFDIALLISLDPAGGESARSIGVGMTPGDSSYGVPYFYVSPWPYPEEAELPALAGGGHWHTEGWVGAVLTAQTIEADADGGVQRARVAAFLNSAIAGCRSLLGAP